MMDGVKWSLGKTNTRCWIAANTPHRDPMGHQAASRWEHWQPCHLPH